MLVRLYIFALKLIMFALKLICTSDILRQKCAPDFTLNSFYFYLAEMRKWALKDFWASNMYIRSSKKLSSYSFGFWRKTIENFFMRITFFPKLQRIDMYCKKYTYIHNQIFYCFCFCHWCHSIPLHQSTKIQKINTNSLYNSSYFVSFCGFSCIWYSFVS